MMMALHFGHDNDVCTTLHYIQSQYSTLQQFNQVPNFFAESDGDYWEPASDTRGLYEQLSNKKYREILRNQIRYVLLYTSHASLFI
jgi:aminoglycoside N3'-acetyltransferase